QKFLHNVFLARPHYFNFATPAVGGGSATVGVVSPIVVPGSAVTIDFSLEFTEPQICFFPDQFSTAPPSALPVAQDHFGIFLSGTICLLVGSTRAPSSICATVDIWTIGHPTSQQLGGNTYVTLSIDQVLTSNTGALGPLLQYVLQQLLNALLSRLQIP